MTNKYEILKTETREHDGRTLFQIRDLASGLLGGWVEHENNLSQLGKCWIDESSKVYGFARISGNARVAESSCVFDTVEITSNVTIERSTVSGSARVGGSAVIEQSKLRNSVRVHGTAKVERSELNGHVEVSGGSFVTASVLDGEATVRDFAIVGNSRLHNFVTVRQSAAIHGSELFNSVSVGGDAKIVNTTLHSYQDFAHLMSFTGYPVTVLNNGYASIGCTLRPIREWISLKYEDQRSVPLEEFTRLRELLLPIFEHFLKKFEQQNKAETQNDAGR